MQTFIRIIEKLILYGFSLYGNGRLKRFVNCCYGIFQQLYCKSLLEHDTLNTLYIFISKTKNL
ncbi:hypothetical protein C5473_13985 [Leptospira interrogans serovar Weerasinghe]|nr:hypothetical protein C5473_13985 [Leptospira interrogans serovar Weerasinghe]